MEVLAALLALIIGAFIVLLFIAGSSIIYGMTLSVLWGWFMVPLFHLPRLGIAQAIGLSLVISYATYQEQKSSPETEPKTDAEKKAASSKNVVAFFAPLTRAISVLVTGWVIQHFFL
jgi:hypothetical protein